MDVTLGRETPCGLEKKDLNTSQGQGFTLPDNMREAFANASFEWVEYQVITSSVC